MRSSKARVRFAFSIMWAIGDSDKELSNEILAEESRPSQTRIWWYDWIRDEST